jgi:hypothetical protein
VEKRLMSNHPQLLVFCFRLKIMFMIPRPYPIVLPKHRRPGFQTGACINTKAASAQVLLDYLTVSPDTCCVFLLYDPDSTLTGGTKKSRPKKFSPMRVMSKDFNRQVVKIEMVPEMSAEQYAIA